MNRSKQNYALDRPCKVIQDSLKMIQLQLQLYLFNLNLQFHDSFHPLIGEPNRGGRRDTNLKKGKEKRNILQTVPAAAK